MEPPRLAALPAARPSDPTRAHNLQQAQRVADYTGFLYVDTQQGGRTGYLIEFGESRQLFEAPAHAHTQQYIRGEFS